MIENHTGLKLLFPAFKHIHTQTHTDTHKHTQTHTDTHRHTDNTFTLF